MQARASKPFPLRRTLLHLFVASALITSGCAGQSQTPQQAAAGEEDFHDPFEDTNRSIFKFNQAVDRAVLVPVAKTYRTILPDPVRDSLRDFLQNLRAPLIFVNNTLQGDFAGAKDTFARFLIDSTIGMGGLVDVAGRWGIPYREQDFGVTLGVWGIAEGPYLVIPVLGPSDTRDFLGEAAESFADPWNILASEHHLLWVTFLRGGVNGIDQRSRYIETLADIERTSLDYYATIRSLYRQRRAALIHHNHQELPPNPGFSSIGGGAQATARTNPNSPPILVSGVSNGFEASR
jgi:phospholipid-binding lipoprotein MlaA